MPSLLVAAAGRGGAATGPCSQWGVPPELVGITALPTHSVLSSHSQGGMRATCSWDQPKRVQAVPWPPAGLPGGGGKPKDAGTCWDDGRAATAAQCYQGPEWQRRGGWSHQARPQGLGVCSSASGFTGLRVAWKRPLQGGSRWWPSPDRPVLPAVPSIQPTSIPGYRTWGGPDR